MKRIRFAALIVPAAIMVTPARGHAQHSEPLSSLLAGSHILTAPGPHPRRCCSAPSRVATAQGCRSLSLAPSRSLGPQALSL